MVDSRFLSALGKIRARLEKSNVKWALVGSLGMAIRGIPIEPHDIDIITDEAGAYEIERLLSQFVLRRVAFRTSDMIQSHFGTLEIDGVRVEIMGDFRIKNSVGNWEESLDLDKHMQIVQIEGEGVPVLRPEWEYQTSLKLGRREKAEMVKTYLMK